MNKGIFKGLNLDGSAKLLSDEKMISIFDGRMRLDIWQYLFNTKYIIINDWCNK